LDPRLPQYSTCQGVHFLLTNQLHNLTAVFRLETFSKFKRFNAARSFKTASGFPFRVAKTTQITTTTSPPVFTLRLFNIRAVPRIFFPFAATVNGCTTSPSDKWRLMRELGRWTGPAITVLTYELQHGTAADSRHQRIDTPQDTVGCWGSAVAAVAAAATDTSSSVPARASDVADPGYF